MGLWLQGHRSRSLTFENSTRWNPQSHTLDSFHRTTCKTSHPNPNESVQLCRRPSTNNHRASPNITCTWLNNQLMQNPRSQSLCNTHWPFQTSRPSPQSRLEHQMDRQCKISRAHFLIMLPPKRKISPPEEIHTIRNSRHEKTNLNQNWNWLQNSPNFLRPGRTIHNRFYIPIYHWPNFQLASEIRNIPK